MKWLYEQSIWHPDAIEPEDFKYRNQKRVWLPLFDIVGILIGLLAVAYGSSILNESYDHALIDFMGNFFMAASAGALIGVAFPRLWVLEILSKLFMMALLGTYSITIWISFFQGQVFSGFIAAILILPIIMPLSRLDTLAEELKQRRAEDHE